MKPDSSKFFNKTAFINGNVLTMEENNPKAQAILVIGERIAWVGTSEGIKNLLDSETEIIDLGGRTVLPGFIDCHAHPINFGLSLMAVNCSTPPQKSIEDIVSAFKEEATKKNPGKWLVGRGYDDFKLREKRHPNKLDLDPVTPSNPAMITRMCGHIMVVNSLVLELAGINKGTEDPAGGKIDRDPETGEPNGVLRGAAIAQVRGLKPQPSADELGMAIGLMSEQFIARGVTSVSEAGISTPDYIRAYQKTINEDVTPLRINLMISRSLMLELNKLGLATGFGDDRLKIGAIKIVLDGSSSGRTAALTQPYEDDPSNAGILYMSCEELVASIKAAHRAGFQVAVHAIGDRAVIGVLDAYENVLKEHPKRDHRFRIEHCGLNDQDIVARIRRLEAIPVPQPIFLYGEGESYRAGWGEERVKWAYPMRSWLEAGIKPAMSSDCPATSGEELISPFLGIYVAVTRRTEQGIELGPEQRITVEDALKSYTINGAHATFEENTKGSIKAGKYADITVLSQDPMAVPAEIIKEISVDMTFIAGRKVYTRKMGSGKL